MSREVDRRPGSVDSWTEEKLPRRRGPLPWLVGGIIACCGLCLTCFAASLIVPMFLQKFAFTSVGKVKADLTQLGSALEEYAQANQGRYPDSLEALVTPDWNGHAYIKATRIPKDPWGNEYRYAPPESEGDLPIVYTLGKDGRPGGEGDDADMSNRSIRSGE